MTLVLERCSVELAGSIRVVIDGAGTKKQW